jgi:dipeptidase E
MKILLTSAGISNKSIENALRKLVKGKIRIAFIPTAATENEDGEEEDWLMQNIAECKKLGDVDVADISKQSKEQWLPKLEEANVILVGGGDTTYLMNWILKSGLAKELPRLLKKRVYVGISAGSMVVSKDIQGKTEHLYGDEIKNPPKGLEYIDFQIRPHLNSPYFPKVRDKNLKELSKKLSGDLYALDDDSAVLYNDGKIEVISEGKWIKYSK